MKIISTDELDGYTFQSVTEPYHIYNGLDCMMTFEIRDVLQKLLAGRPVAQSMYAWRQGMQAISLDMTRRGTLIDDAQRQVILYDERKRHTRLSNIFQRIAEAMALTQVNPRSPKQLKEFFYATLEIPEQKVRGAGEWRVSTNREALEKMLKWLNNQVNQPDIRKAPVKVLMSLRDLEKDIAVLETGPSADGRMRCSYNVAGTETGRWSSSTTVFGEGMNKQNIKKTLRKMFIADPGRKMVNTDQQQAESRVVALISGDAAYMEACNSGDLHTTCCRMFWPELPWNGDLKKDKVIAERPFYRHFSYRDMSKRGGHASNYYAIPWTISRNLKIPMKTAEDFQARYFNAFPGIRAYHRWVSAQLMTKPLLSTPLGEERWFFGRPDDDATLREAIAYVPQSTVGHLTNIVIARLYRAGVEVLENGHDAVLFQIPDKSEDLILPQLQPFFHHELTYKDRTINIPWEFKVGYNWGDLEEWRGDGSTINQERPGKTASFLDQLVL